MITEFEWASSDTTVDEHHATLLRVRVRQPAPDSDGDTRLGVDWEARAPAKGCDSIALQVGYLDDRGQLMGVGDFTYRIDDGFSGGQAMKASDMSSWMRLAPGHVVADLVCWVTAIHHEELEIDELWWGMTGPNARNRHHGHVAVQVTSAEHVPEVELRIKWLNPQGKRVDRDMRTSSLSPGVQVLHGEFYAGEDPGERRPEVRLVARHRRTVRVPGSVG